MDSGMNVHIRIRDDGNVEILNGDDFDWTGLGLVTNQRVANVTFDPHSQAWYVSNMNGEIVSPQGGHRTRREALQFESRWATDRLFTKEES